VAYLLITLDDANFYIILYLHSGMLNHLWNKAIEKLSEPLQNHFGIEKSLDRSHTSRYSSFLDIGVSSWNLHEIHSDYCSWS